MMADEPLAMTIPQLIHAFAGHDLTPLDYWDCLQRHIACWEPHIQALYAYDPENARREASRSSERWAKGRPKGPLDGVPVTVKELIATAGVPVPQGTAATDLQAAPGDAPPAARLREAGAIIFAKTTCPDFGMLTSGLSSFHPLTRNPWRLDLNPGGSSSGAAAAAAAGYGPLHIGTDIGGSIRLPAALCGIAGFKPSFGRIPIDPYYFGRCAGPMTRSIGDAALAMHVLSRPDPRDAMSLPPQEIDWLDLEARSVLEPRGLRLGLMLEAGCGLPVDREISGAVENVARLFETSGAMVVPMSPPVTQEMLVGIDAFWRARAWNDIQRMAPERRQRILPYILQWAEGGAALTGTEVVTGFQQSMAMRAAAARCFEQVDAILAPSCPVVGFPADHASPTNDPQHPFEHIAFTVLWNMGEQPALSVPCGFADSGLPMGLQIITPRFADRLALQLGAFLETHGLWSAATMPSRPADGQVLEP